MTIHYCGDCAACGRPWPSVSPSRYAELLQAAADLAAAQARANGLLLVVEEMRAELQRQLDLKLARIRAFTCVMEPDEEARYLNAPGVMRLRAILAAEPEARVAELLRAKGEGN